MTTQVHNHGTEDGTGLDCAEQLVGACILSAMREDAQREREAHNWAKDQLAQAQAEVKALKDERATLLELIDNAASVSSGMASVLRQVAGK